MGDSRTERWSSLSSRVLAALDRLGIGPSRESAIVARVTDVVYPKIHDSIRFAAEASMSAQLAFLAARR